MSNPSTTAAPLDLAFDAFKTARQEFKQYIGVDLSESDTRSKVIDPILSIMGWREQSIQREWHERTDGKYLDYKLSTTHPVFVVEAKKGFVEFEMPPGSRRHFRVGSAISKCTQLQDAIAQARGYAVNSGIIFCCVTNGFQFAFFRSTNAIGVPWDRQFVMVFRNHDEIENRFSEFYETFSFEAVTTGRFSSHIIVDHLPANEESRFYKIRDDIHLQNAPRDRNVLFPYTRGLILRVFQNLDNDEASSTLLEQCYVESSRDSSYERGIGELLKEHRTKVPGTSKIQTSRNSAGVFQESFESTAGVVHDFGSVTLLVGTVGAGKTSFLNRFRKVYAPDVIQNNYIWVQISFNSFVETTDDLSSWIGEKIQRCLEETYGHLNPLAWESLVEIYSRDIDALRLGTLKPLYKKAPQDFEIKISEYIQRKAEDTETHYIRCLAHFAKKFGLQILLVFDNADQHSPELQNDVFLVAQKHAAGLKCIALISLREESYWKNKEYGALSAFHPTAFQITAPRFEQVLSKRFKYASRLIIENKSIVTATFVTDSLGLSPEGIDKIFRHFQSVLLGEDKRFIRFLEYMAPGEVRLSLDFVARFLTSGHTNVNRLIDGLAQGKMPPIGFHEFLQAVMLGDRTHFLESSSDVINLFRADGMGDQSHFNRLAVLARVLSASGEIGNLGKGFVSVKDILADCESIGISVETAQSIIGLLVEKRLLATETLARDVVTVISSVRATTAAFYYIRELAPTFTYIDLVLTDTEIGDADNREKLIELSKAIVAESDRVKKVSLRLDRASVFIDYLNSEFLKSSLIEASPKFSVEVTGLVAKIKSSFEEQAVSIMSSAQEALGARR